MLHSPISRNALLRDLGAGSGPARLGPGAWRDARSLRLPGCQRPSFFSWPPTPVVVIGVALIWLASRRHRARGGSKGVAQLEVAVPSSPARTGLAEEEICGCDHRDGSCTTSRSRGHRASLAGLGRRIRRTARRPAARPVPAPAAVRRHLPAHRPGGAPQPTRNLPHRLTRGQPTGDLFPFSQRQPQRRSSRLPLRRTVQRHDRPPDRIPGPVDLLMQPPFRGAPGQQLGYPLPPGIRKSGPTSAKIQLDPGRGCCDDPLRPRGNLRVLFASSAQLAHFRSWLRSSGGGPPGRQLERGRRGAGRLFVRSAAVPDPGDLPG
jgi:hypothetical protein